jgi:Domain of unknown function (DUF4388)
MPFTGDLEQLNIVDIIQLINTTRKSGTFSVKGKKGESRIIFSNGYIVGASHLNNKIRIGTVLVKMNAVTLEDLKLAMDLQRKAGRSRKPLIATLMELGKLGHDDALKGLKKLIDITIVELIGWTEGTFTLDTDIIAVSPEVNYPLTRMHQGISLDAQMVLMDALRIFDERERDRRAGKVVPPDEELYADILPSEKTVESVERSAGITADDLGLGDLDHLERKIPEALPANETFDPVQIHRQKIKETLADFSPEEQEAFVSFLERSTVSIDARDGSARQDSRTRALILLSEDELITHSVMTICKAENGLVFTTDGEEELDRIIDQCLRIKASPMLVFDSPDTPGGMLSQEKIVGLRQRIRERHPGVSIIQLASLMDYAFMLQSFRDGIRAVFPKPAREARKETFIRDMMTFLETFHSYIKGFFDERREPSAPDGHLQGLKDRITGLRELHEPSAVSLALLHAVSEMFERTVTFIARPAELAGERAIGVFAEKSAGPTSAAKLKVPLTRPSALRDLVEQGQFFYGERDDEVLKKYLFKSIGAPLSPVMLLLPMKSIGKTVTVTYGDFGEKEASPVQADLLEILANEAGLVLENVLYRKQLSRTSRK